jgi:uncharacterized protein YecT (DUF1311 family)
MMRSIKFIIIIAFFNLLINANSQELTTDKGIKAQQKLFCQKAMKHGDGLEERHCLQMKLDSLNLKLNSIYEKKLSDFYNNDLTLNRDASQAAAPVFKKSQINWKAYRDSMCRANYLYGDGLLRKTEFLDCMIETNIKRIAELTKKIN